MLNPILFNGPTEKLRSILDDDWIIGCLGHDLALILVDEIEIVEDDLNDDTKYRRAFLEAKDDDRVRAFGSICNIPAGKDKKIEVGVIRFDEGAWGLEAFIILPEEDLVDESLEFKPSEEEWEDLFEDFPIDAKYSKAEVKEKIFDAVQAINTKDKKWFVEQFNQTLARYPVGYEHPNVFHDENYLIRAVFVKTSDNRWSIKPRLSISLDRVLQEDSEEETSE